MPAAIFENIEDLLKRLSDISDCSRALVTLASGVGVLIVFFYAIYLTFKLVKLLRLYFFSQLCCKVNFVKKYGQWAVISGATDGIGLGLAKELARRGMSILVISRNEEKLARTKVLLEQQPNVGQVEVVKIDMSDSSLENYDKIRAIVDPSNRDIGVLINNAGVLQTKFCRFNRVNVEDHIATVNLNILGYVHLTRMIMPGMVERGKGLVLNVSSIIGGITAPYLGLYAPTKAFVDSFTKQLQMEYSTHPLDIVLLQPGPVVTKLLTATSKMSKPSFIMPTPDEFAKASINALSTGIKKYTGCVMHHWIKCQSVLFEKLQILNWVLKMNVVMNGKDYELSPVPKRRRVVVVSPNENTTFQTTASNNQPTGVTTASGDGTFS